MPSPASRQNVPRGDDRPAALRRLTLLLDALVLPASAALAMAIHARLRLWLPGLKDPANPSEYISIVAVAVPVWLSLAGLLDLHRLFERRWTPYELFIDLLKLHGLGFLVLASLVYLGQGTINRTIVFTFLTVNFALLFSVRTAAGAWVASSYRRGELRESWLLVGAPSEAMRHFVQAASDDAFAPRWAGVLCDEGNAPEQLTRLGAPADLPRVLHDAQVDLVVFFPPFDRPALAAEWVAACERQGISAAFAVSAGQRFALAPRVLSLGDTPLITYDWIPSRPGRLAVKHALDVLGAGLIIALALPVMALCAVAILLTMGLPVLFSQERMGLHGRRFRMLKFRTMVKDAESQRAALADRNEVTGPVFKIASDPRVTPLGGFLRRWSLDELPQLFNVLAGSMSLVGPRPLPVAEQQEIAGWYRRRLSMKPGITGLWQVSGRSGVDFDEWMRMDLRYVEQWSLRLDLLLLLQTVRAVLTRRGAH